jgi:DNA-binding transcriptional ArsR family regulator
MTDLRSPFLAGRRFTATDADRLATMCKALGHAARWQIIALLAERYYRAEWDPSVRASLAVADLTSAIGLAQSTTSQHLAVLEQVGLVRTDGDGRTIVPEAMARLAGLIDPHGRHGAGQRPSSAGDGGVRS